MTAVPNTRKKITVPPRYFVLVFGATLGILILGGLVRRGAIYYRVSQERILLETRYNAINDYHNWLLNHYETVQSPTYIEMIARNELKWNRPDETVVVIIGDSRPQAPLPIAPISDSPVTNSEATPLQQWRELLLPASTP